MTSLRTAKRFVFPLLGLWVLLYASFSMVKPPLLDGADALSAEIGREMLTAGHWITPWANGYRYAHHSPLLYWTIAWSFGLFGVSDWAARLPVALATLGLFTATFSLGRRIFHAPAAALYATLALMTSYGVFLFGHLLLPDVFLCLWTTLAINCFWRSLEQKQHRLSTAIGFGACCALGVLTQGMAGVLFPLVVVFFYLLFTRQLGYLLRWHPIPAILAFFVIVLPWHIAARVDSGHLRLGALMPAMQGGRVPLFVFWPLLLLWIVPWCAFSLRALRIGSASPHPDRRQQARLLCALWIFTVLVFFSFTARQEFNLISALPPMALLAGGWLAEDESLPHHQGRIAAVILFCIGMAAAAFAGYLLFAAPPPAPGVDIATLLHPHPGSHAVFFGYFFDLTLPAMGAFRVPLWIVFAALLVGVSGGLLFRLRDNARMANCFLAGMIVAILIAAHLALNTFSPVLSSQILAEAIKPEVRPADTVIVNGPFEEASSLAFYLERQLLILSGGPATQSPGSAVSVNPSVFISPADLTTLWSGTARVLLWSPVETLPSLPGPVYVIGRSGGKEIVSNQPNNGGANF